MTDPLHDLLARTPNPAADDLLLEALRRGSPAERERAADVLLFRATRRGTAGLLRHFGDLPAPVRDRLLADLRPLDTALRDAARDGEPDSRAAALALIARAGAARLAGLAAENVTHADPPVAAAAAGALVDLSRRSDYEPEGRRALNAAVVRALGTHDGPHAGALADAALRLGEPADGPVLAVLSAVRHAGKERLLRRLADPPDAATAGAFLTAAGGGHLRPTFAATLARTTDPAAISALLDRTHRLDDPALAAILSTVGTGVFWELERLTTALKGWACEDLPNVARWIGAGKTDPNTLVQLLRRLLEHATGTDAPAVAARRRVAHVLAGRADVPTDVLEGLIDDPAPRVARSAALGLIRRRPAGLEATLLRHLPSAHLAVRRLIARIAGGAAFDAFWDRCDGLPDPARRAAGAALVKLLPDVPSRLRRRLLTGTAAGRVKAIGLADVLGLPGPVVAAAPVLCRDADAGVRSAAILFLGRSKVPDAAALLAAMLADHRPAHRIAAMDALRHLGYWRLLDRVAAMARDDSNPPTRRHAARLLRDVAAEKGKHVA